MTAMVRSFVSQVSWITASFAVLLVLDAVAFLTCLIYLARAYHQQEYTFLPRLKELQEWEDAFVGVFGFEEATEKAASAFEGHLGERIIEAADRNTESNDYRSG